MSLHEYQVSKELINVPFYALIMAAIRRADTPNTIALRLAFPETFKEFEARYHAPGGILSEEEC